LNEFWLGLVQFAIANVDQLMEQGRYFGQNLTYRCDTLQVQLDRIHPGGETVFDKPCNKNYWMFVDWAIRLAQWKYKFNMVLILDGHGLNGLMHYTFGWKGKDATMTHEKGTNLPDPGVHNMKDALYFLQKNPSSHFVYLDPR
jgi:hypothetical protein